MSSPLACRRCGCPHVRWGTTNAGKWYLQFDAGHLDDPDARAYAAGAKKKPHKCPAPSGLPGCAKCYAALTPAQRAALS